ncbi:hypothetical protein J6590_045013 [Homalodisca vitripennis]|nr:hypothetical protein J6590_045013 [Homalodisca vitripennis]
MTVPCLKPLRGADVVSVSADCKSTRLVSVDRDSSLALSRYLIDLRQNNLCYLCEFLLFRCQDLAWLFCHSNNQSDPATINGVRCGVVHQEITGITRKTTSTVTAEGEERKNLAASPLPREKTEGDEKPGVVRRRQQ